MVEVEYRIPEYNGKGHLHITVSIGEIYKSVFKWSFSRWTQNFCNATEDIEDIKIFLCMW